MSNRPAQPGSAGGGKARRRGWTVDSGQAETVIAGARNALFVMVAFLAVIWIVQIVNWADHYHLTLDYGIRPRDLPALPYILTAPFLHFSWTHIEGNSGPLFIFGFLAAYRGIAKFAGVTAVVLLPHQGIGWQAHVGGLAGGIVSGWLFRDRRAARSRRAAPGAAASRPAAGTSSTVAVSPAAQTSLDSGSGSAAQPSEGGRKKKFAVDPANPRADLYKQLDDLGL